MFGNLFNTNKDQGENGQEVTTNSTTVSMGGFDPLIRTTNITVNPQNGQMQQGYYPQQMPPQFPQMQGYNPGMNGMMPPQMPQMPQMPQNPGMMGEAVSEETNMDLETKENVFALSRLDPRSIQVLHHAEQETKRIMQQSINSEQLLLGLFYDGEIFRILQNFNVNIS